VQALVDGDAGLARRTIEIDAKVNSFERETDELCLLVLAKRQPLASDLRFITLALKMVTDLERIGDLAVNICERAIDLSEGPRFDSFADITRMAEIAQQMVTDAIDAFVRGDADRAQAVLDRDDDLDDLYHHVFRALLAQMLRDQSLIERVIHVQSVAKVLERIGDHATNLAEHVVFMVNGTDIRHKGKLDSR
jgi:phosphate transport system protein